MTRTHNRRRWAAAIAMVIATAVPAIAQAETLTPDEALRRAAAENITLKAALLDVTSAQQSVEAEEGSRDPMFIASLQGNYTESAGTHRLSSQESISSKAALRYTTDIGTELEVGTTGDILWHDATSTLDTGPRYTALAYMSARQPLLKGAGTDSQLAGLHNAESAAVAAERERDATANQVAFDVVNAYWELWYADQAVGVQEKALETAEQQLEDAKARESQIGTASKADVLQFESNLASIQDSLSQAEATKRTRAIQLGKLLGMGPEAAAALDASGKLPALGAAPTTSDLVEQAEKSSPTLAALRARIDSAVSQVASAENADQPQLDLFVNASAGALWQNDGIGGLDLSGGRPAFAVTGGLELTLPIGGGRADAEAARAHTELSSAQTRYEDQSLALKTQIGTLRSDLTATEKQIQLAAETARINRALAEAEHQRLLLGTTTSQNVVLAEQSLRSAELRELRVQVNRVVTQYQLEQVTGSLLDRFGSVFLGRKS